MSDEVSLVIDGEEYTGWNEIRVSRALKESAATFDIAVSERWAGLGSQPWQILPFEEVQVYIDEDIVLSGYVDSYEPSYDSDAHSVRIGGRSRTCDLVDCMPDVGTGQFSGYKLDAIASALGSYFQVGVVVECDVGDPLPDATIEKTETAFSFLEKLARLRAVMLTDDVNGNLVLTRAGAKGGAGALVQGQNILSASAKINGNERFRQYVCLSQTPVRKGSDAQTQVIGTATDPGCKRNRRYVETAENPSTQSEATDRARWRALHNFGSSTEATVTVSGWRQPQADGNPGGALWDTNLLVPVTSPFLALDRQLLISKCEFQLDDSGGRRTVLTVAPQEAFTPEGAKVGSMGDTGNSWNNGPK